MTPAQALAVVAVFGSALSCIVAASSAIAMAHYRAPGVTLKYLAMHGTAFADERNFTKDAVRYQTRLLHAFGVLVTFVFVALIVNAIGTT